MPESTDLEKKPSEELQEQSQTFAGQAVEIAVTDVQSYQAAAELYKLGKALRKQIVDYFKDSKAAASALHKRICKMEKDELAKLDPPLKQIDGKLSAYDRQVAEEKRRIEKARQEEEARIAREKAEAERLRIEAEEKALQEAAALEEEGRVEEAERVIEVATTTDPTPLELFEPEPEREPEPEAPEVEGVSKPIPIYGYKITDRNLIPRRFWVLDEKAINAEVQAKKAETKIPGVEVEITGYRRQVR